MYVSNAPTFEPWWYRFGDPGQPAWLDDDRWVPAGEQAVYAYARSGLYALLDGLEPGIAAIPEYLPPGVVDVFHRTGFDVEFYPVTAAFGLPEERVARLLTEQSPAVTMFVHYFGFADEAFPRLLATARDAGSFVIEDVARGLFATDSAGRLLGTEGDAAIFSFRKVLPVPRGGLVVAPGVDLPQAGASHGRGRELLQSAAVTGARYLGWVPGQPDDPGQPTLRFTDPATLDAPLPPGLWPPTTPGPLTWIGLDRCTPASVRSARQERYRELYDRMIELDGVSIVSPPPYDGACPYGIVLHVTGGRSVADAILSALWSSGLPAEAFRWPIAVPADQRYRFHDAPTIRHATVVIPTHPQVPMAALERIADTVASCL